MTTDPTPPKKRARRLQPANKTARQIELHARRHRTTLTTTKPPRGTRDNAPGRDDEHDLDDEQVALQRARARMNGIRYDLGTKLTALALLDSGKTAYAVGKEMRVAVNTVREWATDDDLRRLNSDAVDRLKKTFAGLMAKGVDMTGQAIIAQPERVWAQTPKDNAITLGILHQNYRLATDQSTENVAHRGVLQEILDEKAKIAERLRVLSIEQERRNNARLNASPQG